MMIVLDRRFTLPQWISLILSVVGIVIVQLGGQQHQSEHHAAHSLYPSAAGKFLGLAAVLLMCLTTAFGSRFLNVLPFVAYF
jgi:drug/metabolite transporter (DMT)-like permease